MTLMSSSLAANRRSMSDRLPPADALRSPGLATDDLVLRIRSAPDGLPKGSLLRDLDTLTGSRTTSDTLVRGEPLPKRVQLADASNFSWKDLRVQTDTARGFGYPQAKGVANPPSESRVNGIANGALRIVRGVVLVEILKELAGPAPVHKSQTAIGKDGDLALTIYGKTYKGPEAGTAHFTRGFDGPKLDVPVTMTPQGLRFDPDQLEKALGHKLPPELQVQTQPKSQTDLAPQARPAPPPGTAPLPKDKDHDSRSCRTLGQFVPDPGYAAREKLQPQANRYQDYIGGHPGQQFRVADPSRATGKVDFDGCKDTPKGPHLLEAKGDHRGMIDKEWFREGRKSLIDQAGAQQKVVDRLGVTAEWDVRTKVDAAAIKALLKDKATGVTIPVIHKPMPGDSQ